MAFFLAYLSLSLSQKVSLLELPGITWTAESLERFKQNIHLEVGVLLLFGRRVVAVGWCVASFGRRIVAGPVCA
jgi:hypothetical protein